MSLSRSDMRIRDRSSFRHRRLAHCPGRFATVAWRRVILGAAILGCVLVARPAMAGCGNGVLEGSEECDPGGGLYIDGNPALGSCTTGTNCFYASSCCKFNCQFVGQGASCFDGNTCTAGDVCNQVGGCDGNDLPLGTACNDGLFCTAVDSCNASGTCVGVGDPCLGGSECADSCSEISDSCNDPNGTACGNAVNNDCTDPDTCNGAGACVPNHASAGAGAATLCNDGNQCTADVCNGTGGCANPNRTAGATCGDPANTSCSNPDSCDGVGNCLDNDEGAGTACGDTTDDACRNPDVCDGSGVCLDDDEAVGTSCGSGLDDGCTDPDTCDANGDCRANHAVAGTSCGSLVNDSCTDPDTCNGAGSCQSNNAVAGTSCGSPLNDDCTDADTCNGAGACSPNHASLGTPAATSCNDSNECTADVCNGSGGCAHPSQPAGVVCGDPSDTSCANPDSCNGLGTCVGNDEPIGTICGDPADDDCRNPDVCDGTGACADADEAVGTACGSPVESDCTEPDTCDATGNCAANHAAAGAPAASTCDDQNDCTADECDGAGACANPSLAAGTPCGDSTTGVCTTPDTCSGSGVCDANHAPDGQSCDDDDACTSDGSCTGGACVAGSAVVCDDGQPCTYDHCDSLSGQCVFDDEPRPDCLPTLDAQIKLANRQNDATDKLKWLWKRTPDFLPEGLPPEGLGDPINLTEYTLCIFDGRAGESTLVAHLDVPAGLSWQQKRPGFFKYNDRARTSDGLFRGALRAGVKGAVGFAAGGADLPLPAAASGTSYFEMMPSLTTQLSNNEGACWIADFTNAKVNRGDTFKTTRKAVVIPH